MCSLVRDQCSLTGICRCRDFRCLSVAGEPTPGLPLCEAPCSSSIIINLGHEGLVLLSSIHSHKTPLLSFTASLIANCISRRPKLHRHFSVPLKQRGRYSPRSIAGQVGEGVAQLGVSRRGIFVLLFAHLGRWWCEEAPDGCDFLSSGRELPPRARPDRRPDLRGGSCCAAGLRSLRFHFGDLRLAPGVC